jgi:hypothetical protein
MSVGNTWGTSSAKGESNTESGSASALRDYARVFINETTDLRQGIISELSKGLSGELSDTQQGLVSQAIENSLQAGSRSREQVGNELARTGLSGTPFGISQLATTIQQGAANTAGISPNMKNSIYNNALQMASSFVLGQNQAAFGGLGNAISGDQNTTTKGDSVGQSTTGSFSYGSKGKS